MLTCSMSRLLHTIGTDWDILLYSANTCHMDWLVVVFLMHGILMYGTKSIAVTTIDKNCSYKQPRLYVNIFK